MSRSFLISDFSKGAALIGETIVFICDVQQAFSLLCTTVALIDGEV